MGNKSKKKIRGTVKSLEILNDNKISITINAKDKIGNIIVSYGDDIDEVKGISFLKDFKLKKFNANTILANMLLTLYQTQELAIFEYEGKELKSIKVPASE